jgi:hypothetical protein
LRGLEHKRVLGGPYETSAACGAQRGGSQPAGACRLSPISKRETGRIEKAVVKKIMAAIRKGVSGHGRALAQAAPSPYMALTYFVLEGSQWKANARSRP